MSINLEREVFERRRPDEAALAEFGFALCGGSYVYEEELAGGDLCAEISVTGAGGRSGGAGRLPGLPDMNSVRCGISTVTGRVYDPESGEEYAPLRVEAPVGTYAAEVRVEYMSLLRRIGDSCFRPVDFVSDQANRIAERLLAGYGDRPDFPFKDDDSGIWRITAGGRWYMILMNVESRHLKVLPEITGDEESASTMPLDDKGRITDGYLELLRKGVRDPRRQPDRKVEIINVKVEERDLPALLEEDGIYICYHMNKKMWISIVLDDTLPDERILELIDRSRALVSGKHGSVPAAGSGAALAEAKHAAGQPAIWLIPSRPAQYDVDAGFRDSPDGTLSWHQNIRAAEGDIVYIYQSEPVASVRFKCEVVRANAPREEFWEIGENGEMELPDGIPEKYSRWLSKPVMVLRLLETYEKGLFPRSFINEHGVAKTVRGQRSCPQNLADAIDAVLSSRAEP